jgi:DNA-binding MarR family transcriptional regulator
MSRKLNLQDFLPYLLNRAGLRIGVMFSHDIGEFGVTLPMWRVLVELWHNGDHRLGELAERASIDLSTLSRLLVTMQRKGLIVRRRSGLDGRALSLTLTKRGMELTERIVPYARHYENIAMRRLSARDIARLKELLKIIYDNLHDAEDQTARRKPIPRASKRAGKSKKVVKASA